MRFSQNVNLRWLNLCSDFYQSVLTIWWLQTWHINGTHPTHPLHCSYFKTNWSIFYWIRQGFFNKMFLSVFHFEFIRFIWNLYESTFMIFRWEGLNQKSSQRWMDERAKIAPKMFVPTSKARSYTQSRYNREWLSPISRIDSQFSDYMGSSGQLL